MKPRLFSCPGLALLGSSDALLQLPALQRCLAFDASKPILKMSSLRRISSLLHGGGDTTAVAPMRLATTQGFTAAATFGRRCD